MNTKSKQQLREQIVATAVQRAIMNNEDRQWLADQIMQAFESFHTGEVEKAAINGFEYKIVPCDGCGQLKPMVTRTYAKDGAKGGYICEDCFNKATRQSIESDKS